jgi:uncharacterized protein (TIGR00661 family)
MNIVYGVSGEGLGHVFEAVQVVTRLREEGHSVKVLTYGERALRCLAEFQPTEIEGIHLEMGPRGMSLARTVARNARIFPYFARNWGRLRREIEEFEPDVFLTAYEPFTMVAAHAFGRPLISMDNQNELLHAAAPPGTNLLSLWVVQLATILCTCGARAYVIKSLVRRGRSGPKLRYVAPIIQREIRSVKPSYDGPVLVYLTKRNPALIEVLKSLDEPFVVYCHGQVGTDGNVTYRAQGPSFLGDLAACKAIIATTGFSLISDALFLKKPYFGVPVRGQFEQAYNAHFVTELGIGESSPFPGREDLGLFLSGLSRYRERLAHYNLDPADQENALLEILRDIGAEVPQTALAS